MSVRVTTVAKRPQHATCMDTIAAARHVLRSAHARRETEAPDIVVRFCWGRLLAACRPHFNLFLAPEHGPVPLTGLGVGHEF